MKSQIWVSVCLLVMGVGCGDDDKGGSDAGDGAVGYSGDGDGTGGTGGDGDGTGGTGGDGDGTGGDGDAGMAGDGDGVSGDGDGDSPGDGDGGGLPQDGRVLTPCYATDDCAMDLECYGGQEPNGFSSGQIGHCAEGCSNDRDCTDIGGVLTLCSDNSSACRVDCSEDGDGDGTDGVCPDGLECSRNRCLPPEDAFATKAPFEACDPDLVECTGEQVCAEQNLLGLPVPRLDGPQGFCTSECSSDADCMNGGGAGGSAACIIPAPLSPGICVIECMNDRQCPAALVCEVTGPLSSDACALPGN